MSMETFYAWVGFVTVMISILIGSGMLIWASFSFIINVWAKFSKTPYRMLEYFIYRKEFKEWVKDKERHVKLKDEK